MKSTTPPDTFSPRRSTLVAAAMMAIVALMVVTPRAEAQTPPQVPANLDVPSGNTAFLVGHAHGTQNYLCMLKPGGFEWTFFGPQATLFDGDGQQLITHFLSANPDENGTARATWQESDDTSAVWALAIASSTDPGYVAPGAIPWLLLRVVGAEVGPTGGATLSAATFVQRVNTRGGVAPPPNTCKQAVDVGRKALVPYLADYVFYQN